MIGAPPCFRLAESVDLHAMAGHKIGRPSKGPREQLNVRLPVRLHEAIRLAAARDGMTVNDFVGHALADKVGDRYVEQEALPLPETA